MGQIIKNKNEILEKTKSFYQSLYGSREDSITNIDLENQEESSAMEREITLEEAGNTLKNMKSNRSTGSDRWLHLWILQNILEANRGFCCKINKLCLSRRTSLCNSKQGIITCLPKGDKPRHFFFKLETYFSAKYCIENSFLFHCL